jgi:hypothetical protein
MTYKDKRERLNVAPMMRSSPVTSGYVIYDHILPPVPQTMHGRANSM